MALLEEHSDENKVQLNEETEWIEEELVFGTWEKISPVGGYAVETWYRMKQHTKRKRQCFEYVGMTKDAAEDCRDAMIEEYTKAVKVSEWNQLDGVWEEKDGGEILMAEVACEWVEGHMWKVNVNVNETYTLMSKENEGVTF